jgi:hypothetical protein
MRPILFLCCVVLPAENPATKPTPDPEHVRQLVVLLDDDLFAVRCQADRDLRKLGTAIVPQLEKELPKAPSLEVQLRLTRMLEDLGGEERRFTMLMKQLREDNFSRRAEADRGLRKLSKKTVPLLAREMNRLAEAGGDLETRRRLEKIIQAIETGEDEETPRMRPLITK